MSQRKHSESYYVPWLTDQACGDEYKKLFAEKYEEFFEEKDKEKRKQKLDELLVYLTVVCDIVAYRYLVKHYSNLFKRLGVTVEEYIDYKVQRMYNTLRDKKEKINDVMSYVFMSFMLSSPRLIYDYGEKAGRCQLIKDVLPYFKTQRLKFFFVDREVNIEHIIFSVDNLDLDGDSELLHSNIEKYSLEQYNKTESSKDGNDNSRFDKLCEFIAMQDFNFDESREYLLHFFSIWEESGEEDFELVKKKVNSKTNFTFQDYIRYKYEHQQTNLTYDQYVDVLRVLNIILKSF